jgi:hypothetical protein
MKGRITTEYVQRYVSFENREMKALILVEITECEGEGAERSDLACGGRSGSVQMWL